MDRLYAKIPHVEKKVSRILYGTASEPFMSGGNCDEYFDKMFDLGINTIDGTRVYK